MTSECYLFGRFKLSADGTLLACEGAVVPLAPKVLQTLLVLVQRAGEVVRKEDLLQAVWPDTYVEDTGLTRNISLLRQALGDDGERLIVTVARVGYRFAGSAQRVSGAALSTRSEVRRVPTDRPHSERGQLIVGRDTELNLLRDAFRSVRGGRGGVLAIAGEPGIGKTTVVERFLQEEEETCHIGRGRCSERLAGAEPHLPLLEALDELTAANPALFDSLCRTAPTWSAYVTPRGLGHRGDLDTQEQSGTGSPERLMRELTTFLEDASQHRPVVIFIEDLHWADIATIDVLAHLAPRLVHIRLLVLLTYREREMLVTKHPFARLRGDLIGRGHLTEVQVSLLALDHVRDYVRSTFGNGPVPAELAALVFERTEGNPLFMADLVRYLRQKGISERNLSLVRDIPDSLRGLIERTLQELDAGTRQLLSIAAVQGYAFDSATVARVCGTAPADVEDRFRTADQVDALVKFERQEELPDGTLALVYHFVHVLYQDALIDAIAPSRRVALAHQIGEALVVSHATRIDTIAAELAILFETGRDFWQAAHYFLIASRNAVRLFAFATATELASRGLHCLGSAQGVDAHDRLRCELDLTFAWLVPLASLQGYASAEVEQLARRVVQLGERVGDPAATAAGLAATWIVRMVRGDCCAAKQAGERLAVLAGETGSDVLLINGHMHTQIACHHLGEFREAAARAAAVQAIAPRVSHTERCIGVLDPVVASLAESARNLWITGHLARACAECDRAVALGRDLRHPDSLAFAWLFHGWVLGYRGDWPMALASVDSGIAIAQESGSVQTLAWNRCVRGWALAHLGKIDAGYSELAAGIEASKQIMGAVALPQFSAMIAEVLLLRKDFDSAEEWLIRAMDVENANDDRYFSAEIHRLSAICLAARGQNAEAREQLYKALELSRSQGARFFELRAAIALARYDRKEGHAAVCSALGSFPEPEPWPEIQAAQRIVS